jgi:hypothetical protein
MNAKKLGVILICFSLIFSIVPIAYADSNGSYTYYGNHKQDDDTFWAPMYNPSGGGFLASISFKIGNQFTYKPVSSGSKQDYLITDAWVSTGKASFTQCGGYMNIRNSVRITEDGNNWSLISLPYGSSYWIDSNTRIEGKHSNQFTYGFVPYSFTAEAEGSFFPDGSKCSGGRTAQLEWTFTR